MNFINKIPKLIAFCAFILQITSSDFSKYIQINYFSLRTYNNNVKAFYSMHISASFKKVNINMLDSFFVLFTFKKPKQ